MARSFDWKNLDSGTVVRLLEGRGLDGLTTDDNYRELIRSVEIEAPPEVVLDFSSVRRISAAGIRRLLVLKEKVASRGGAITLRHVGDRIRQVFALTRLTHYFGLQPAPRMRERFSA